MAEHGDNVVTVCVKVKIAGGQAQGPISTPVVAMASAPEPAAPPPQPKSTPFVPYGISFPLPAPQETVVRQVSGKNFISASGSKVVGGVAARVVWAKVYPRTGVTVPPRPDIGALSVASSADGSWAFNQANAKELPDAICATGSCQSANNTLVVWYDFASQPNYLTEVVEFCGRCPVGSGSGASLPSTLVVHSASAESFSVGPTCWRVRAEGFAPHPWSDFNRTWELRLSQSTGGAYVWDNGKDGRVAPRVELRTERPSPSLFQLLFQWGPVVAHYVQPAAEWSSMRPNTFTTCLTRTEPSLHLPATVLLEPA